MIGGRRRCERPELGVLTNRTTPPVSDPLRMDSIITFFVMFGLVLRIALWGCWLILQHQQPSDRQLKLMFQGLADTVVREWSSSVHFPGFQGALGYNRPIVTFLVRYHFIVWYLILTMEIP
ncbi:hypothetical protein BD309DRAFT_961117 [Dichomitus squalens]|nr:hypothetical protein BD309DRAFT_961117 [Dichomitus squalens]